MRNKEKKEIQKRILRYKQGGNKKQIRWSKQIGKFHFWKSEDAKYKSHI